MALYLADTAVTIIRRTRGGRDVVPPPPQPRLPAPHPTRLVPHPHHWPGGGVDATCSALGAVALLDSMAARLIADVTLAGVLLAYLLSPVLPGRRLTTPSPTNA